MLELLFYAILIGITASVYRHILLKTDALAWWLKVGHRYMGKMWAKPIWFCDKCISGQLALWFLILNVLFRLKTPILSDLIIFVIPIVENEDINALNGFILISISVLTTTIISKKINNE